MKPVPYSRGSADDQHEPDDTEQDVALRYALLPSGRVFNLLPLVLVCSVTEVSCGFRDIGRQLPGTRAVAVDSRKTHAPSTRKEFTILKTYPCFLLLHFFPPSLTPDAMTASACFPSGGSFNSQVSKRAELVGYVGGSVIFPGDPLTYVRRAMQ